MMRICSVIAGAVVVVALAAPGLAQQPSPERDQHQEQHQQHHPPGGMGGPGVGGMMGGGMMRGGAPGPFDPMMGCPRVAGQPEAQRLQMCGDLLKARADMLRAMGDILLKYGKMMERPAR